MKTLLLALVCCAMLIAAPVFAQDDAADAPVFFLNYTPFNTDVYLNDAETPVIPELEGFTRFVYFAEPGEVTAVMHEVGEGFPIANSVTFDAAPDTVNFVILYRIDGDPTLFQFEPGELAGEPIDYAGQSSWLYVNLVTDAVDVYFNDELVIDDLAYGDAAVAFAPFEVFSEEMRDADTDDVIDSYDDLYGEPYYTLLDIREIDGEEYFIDIYEYVFTDILTYLQSYNALDIDLDTSTYSTFLELVELADLTETIATADELNVLVPTDAAFDALPDGALEALRDDPDALREVLLGHVFAFGQFEDEVEGVRELETLAGTTLSYEFDEELGVDTVNGVAWAFFLLSINDGRLANIIAVESVLLPE